MKYFPFISGVTCVARQENRGGARNFEQKPEKRRIIQDHIKSFTCRASHYARRGAPGRKYLPSDLCVRKMHQLFLEQNHIQCSYGLYYSVFSEAEKREESIRLLLHRRRARRFYDVMNAVDDSFTVCFNIMENLVLPKTPIGQAYYSRQLYMYVFGVVRHRGRGMPQGKHDIYLYVWMEHENCKDSKMVASALNHYLS